MAISESVAVRNAKVTAVTGRLNAGRIRGYTGASPGIGVAATGTLLFEMTFGNPAFGAAANGAANANAITGDTAADATGTLGYVRVFQSDGTTAEHDGTVGTSGQDYNFNTLSIQSGGPVNLTSMSYNQP